MKTSNWTNESDGDTLVQKIQTQTAALRACAADG